jgi:hypothetical protein
VGAILTTQPQASEESAADLAFAVNAAGSGLITLGGVKRVASAPEVRPTYGQAAVSAQSRLALFTWLGYIITVVSLAGAGFGELYVDNAIFGANLWSDYFALIGWGFASEATRAAITDTLRGAGEQKQNQ